MRSLFQVSIANPAMYHHAVLILKLKTSEEKWIIDAADVQFGFQDVLIPFDKYFKEKECQDLKRLHPYDANETKDIDYFSTLPFMRATANNARSWRRSELLVSILQRLLGRTFKTVARVSIKICFLAPHQISALNLTSLLGI